MKNLTKTRSLSSNSSRKSALEMGSLADHARRSGDIQQVESPSLSGHDRVIKTKKQPVPTRTPGLGHPSAFDLYLREIGQVALLTPDEEVALAARIQKGDEQAREMMIRANLRLVVKIAREYQGLGLPMLDLINEGNIGLMRAVEKFDPAKGGKLSTYSSWWIKQSMRRALANQSRTIRLPVNAVDQIYHLHQAASKFLETFGREATDEELAADMGLKASRVAELRQANVRVASLDMPLGDDPNHSLSEIVEDDHAEDPYQKLEDKGALDQMVGLLDRLSQRERTILAHRFGLGGQQEKTLEEIGHLLGVTRERIRQLQNQALNKLRSLLMENETIQVAA